jgi:hypothetical protein
VRRAPDRLCWLTGKDATNGADVPSLKTTVRALWNEQHLYLGYEAPYTELTTFDHGPVCVAGS